MKIVGMLFTIKPQIPLFSHYCWCYNLYEPEIFIFIGQTLFFLGIISFKLKENCPKLVYSFKVVWSEFVLFFFHNCLKDIYSMSNIDFCLLWLLESSIPVIFYNFIVTIIFRLFFTVKRITWNLIHIPNKTLPDMTWYRMPLHICESLD
jgi:hypothetical protein